MGLEVWLEFAGYCNQSKGELLHWWIPLFCILKCLTDVVYRFLHLIFFSDQVRIDGGRGYS